MLKILDKYIIGKFLKAFFFIALIFSMIAVVIDFSEKIDDFIEEGLSFGTIIMGYYLPYIPYINSLLWPLFALIAVIFFTSRMAYNSEIISIIGNGVNFYRLLVPYLIAGGILMLIHGIGNHYWIPLANKQRILFEHTYIWKTDKSTRTRNVHLQLSPEKKIYMRHYNIKDTMGLDFSIEHIVDGALKSKLQAKKAIWQKYPDTWRLERYYVRTMDGLNEQIIKGEKLDTTLGFAPTDIQRRHNIKETMTSAELLDFVEREKTRGAGNYDIYEVEYERRTADSFTILILTIIGLSFASRKVRGGMGLHLALGALVGSLYILLSKFSMTFSIKGGLEPMLGVWIPNIIFTVVAIWLLLRAQK